MFSSFVLGSGDFPGRKAHELALAAVGWTGLVVALVAGWVAGLLVVGGGYVLAAVAGRSRSRTVGTGADAPVEIDLRLERVLDRLEDDAHR